MKKKAVRAMAPIAKEIDKIKLEPSLDEENTRLLLEYSKTKDDKIRNQIILNNTKLVPFVICKFYPRKTVSKDLIQEGTLGLFEAIKGFDISKGYKFSTYATIWIRQAVSNFLSKEDTRVYVPNHIKAAQNKVLKITRDKDKDIKNNTAEEIADICSKAEINTKTYEKVIQSLTGTYMVYFEDIAQDVSKKDKGVKYYSWFKNVVKIESEDEKNTDSALLLEKIRVSLEKLNDKEKLALLLRYDAIEATEAKKMMEKIIQKKVKK